MDWVSKFKVINQIKIKILDTLHSIMCLQRNNRTLDNVKEWKKIFVPLCKPIFENIGYSKTYQLHEYINKNTVQ